MLKVIIFIISLSVFTGCNKDQTENQKDPKAPVSKDENTKTDTQVIKSSDTKSGLVFSENNFGDYVNADYKDRAKGFDWVAVTIRPYDESKALVTIRSRADKMKPSCTFDALANIDGPNSLNVNVQSGTMKLNFSNNNVEITAEPGSEEAILSYYCRGGASLKGSYQKTDEPLDKNQMDKRSYVTTLQTKGSDIVCFVEVLGNKLTIQPSGLKEDNTAITQTIDGMVTDAQMVEMDDTGYQQIFIFTTSEGSGSYGNIIGYVVNNGKSITPVTIPNITDNKEASEGYMGHDQFEVMENQLVRRFPFYKPGDTNANPTGGTKQIQYKLVPGEATWQLVIDKIIVY